MAMPLALHNVSFTLNNGQTLFNSITAQFSHRLCGLVGINGVGKSVLAQILSGRLLPSDGQITAPAHVAYVPQQWTGQASDPVLAVLGLAAPVAAIERIEAGSVDERDFELAEAFWDWPVQLRTALNTVGFINDLDLQRPIASFSGGEQFRVMWAAALLKNPDVYVFDEPTNHLDRDGKVLLSTWLETTNKQFVLVTHDRALLQTVEAIYELTPTQIHTHPGNYDAYFQGKHARWEQQESQLNQARRQQKQTAIKAQQALEKQQQRVAQGKAKAKRENWSVLERDGAKQAAENSMRNAKILRDNRSERRLQDTQLAENQREWFDPIGFELPASKVSSAKAVLTLTNACAGYTQALHPPLTLSLNGPFRLHITGRNGAGKSALLKTILGRENLWQGEVFTHVPVAYLDQHFFGFQAQQSALENLLALQPELNEKEGRDRLAWLRLRNTKADVPFGALSGGEQLKVVLASKLLGKVTPQLLLLDEPTNHLDLDSTIALENALAQFQGAIILVSHDDYFVQQQRITHRLDLDMLSG